MELIDRSLFYASKVLNKGYWSASKFVKPGPKIQEIHTKDQKYGSNYPEFVRVVEESAFIEPDWGYIITANGCLVEDSLNPNFLHPIQNWRIGTPSVPKFLKAKHGTEPEVLHFPAVISLRHFWEWNYYHFYYDVLGKMKLLNDYGFYGDIPIVLGRYAMEMPWVKGVLEQGKLAKRTWVIPDRQFIAADKIIYCNTQQNYKEKMDFLLDEMEVPQPRSDENDRVFLTRGKGSTRPLLNLEELRCVLDEYQFRIVDTAGKSISEQISIFNKARYLVAVHGAGTTNAIFRRDGAMSLLELHPRGFISKDFLRTCLEYHREYDTLEGDPEKGEVLIHAGISFSPEKLREKLEKMLSQP